MNTIRGKTQEVHIGSSSITITDQHGHSNSVGLNDIAAVGVNRSSVEIEICNFPSSTRISIEFSSYSDATSACREIYAATPMSKEIKIDGNILRIGAPYGYGGKSIRMDEVKEARVDYNGMLEIQCIASYNSVSIRRKSTSAAKQEADMINEWLRKKEQTVEAEAKRNAVRQREREPKQQERREPERIPYVGQPRPKGQFKGTLKTVGLIVLALFAISFLRGIGNRTSSNSKSIDKECLYTDSLGNRYRYNISYTGDEPTVYSRTPNELINEWKNNVAKAEETYQKENVYIVTDGYIDSINKNESDDSYYIMLTEDPNEWSLFGSNEIRVSFHNEREYQTLLDYNTGDHITIVCYSNDTTFFMEYPKLEALLVLNIVYETKPLKDKTSAEQYGEKPVVSELDSISDTISAAEYEEKDVAIQDKTPQTNSEQAEEADRPLEVELHVHTYVESVVAKPSCTEVGVTVYTCACGDTYQEDIAAFGHTTAEWKCSRCGYNFTEPVTVTGHGDGVVVHIPYGKYTVEGSFSDGCHDNTGVTVWYIGVDYCAIEFQESLRSQNEGNGVATLDYHSDRGIGEPQDGEISTSFNGDYTLTFTPVNE